MQIKNTVNNPKQKLVQCLCKQLQDLESNPIVNSFLKQLQEKLPKIPQELTGFADYLVNSQSDAELRMNIILLFLDTLKEHATEETHILSI